MSPYRCQSICSLIQIVSTEALNKEMVASFFFSFFKIIHSMNLQTKNYKITNYNYDFSATTLNINHMKHLNRQ